MKIKTILPILLVASASCSKLISYTNLSQQGSKYDHKKEVVKGDLLVIKGKGIVCNKLKVGKNVCVDHQLTFNNKGCNALFAKGTQEKNLLNLRSTLCLTSNPGLSCSLNNNCVTNGEPAVGCLDITSSACQNRVKVCAGEGIATKKASVSVSGSSCLSQITQMPSDASSPDEQSISVTTNVQVELCIPVFFCIPFCDQPTLQVTSDDNAHNPIRSACVQDKIIGNDANSNSCDLSGHSVTTFLGTEVRVQNISHCRAFIKYTLNYQNCIGITAEITTSLTSCIPALQARACTEQRAAVKDICKHANELLASACFDINAEGRVL